MEAAFTFKEPVAFLVGYLTTLSVSMLHNVNDGVINECGAVG
jgi:hypothetical protein